ncbi:sodium:solute symporter family transporter, partial [Trichlorobacter lovleyi]|uniref:sodium:solute symporter family transporter n=1 Tax=Trichlorobacter lovleyi TaxID=313985 RepID=UPI003C6ED287
HATPQEQVVAARVASVIVGIMAITVGIMAKGQNVAHLVALAFAVAASSNLPAVFLTLYWKKCNTGGIIAGMLVGAITAIALVMVSPNMTYPQAVIKAAKKVIEGEPASEAKPAVEAKPGEGFACELFAVCKKAEPAKHAELAKPAKPGTREKLVTLQAKLDAATDEAEKKTIQGDLEKVKKAHDKAEGDLKKFEGQTTSM